MITERGEPGERLSAMVSSAERVHVFAAGCSLWHRVVMIKVASIGGYRAGGEAASAGPDLDGFR